MTPSFFRGPSINSSQVFGPWLIAIGLSMLLISVLSPGIPAVTAMAIVALGATQSTFTRFRHSPALLTIMLFHASVYLSLYVIFVCAVLYAPATSLGHAFSWSVALDLAASILPMAIALQIAGSSLQLPADSRP